MKILKNLNPAQREAVEYLDSPQMIVAGAGSGKTRVLTYKIAYLLENDFDPSTILALTFTNKAANEMKQRIKELVGSKAESIWMGTFHSIFSRILRIESQHINYSSNFSIYDTEDSHSLVSNIMQEMNLTIESLNPNSVHHRISSLKNSMIYPDVYKNNIAESIIEKKIAEVYEEYNKRLVINNAMDFDDLLLKPIELFNSNDKVLQKYKKKFCYVLVDEYQDTNRAQYEILKMLVGNKKHICVVGDDAQSIYGWRGAEIKNMLDFEKDFLKSKVFRLEQNYRSTKMILAAADSIIKNNKDQIVKTLWTENNDGEQLTIVKCSDEKDEAHQITKLIKEEVSKKKLSYKDFTILYRINSQSRALEEAFRREKIPYKIVGGIEFFKRKEVKDLIAYLRILSNQNDEESLLRIMNFPQRGIGNTSISKMIAFARKFNITLFETMGRVFEVIEVKERIQKNVKAFKILLDKYIELKDQLSLFELTSALIDELGILKIYKEENTNESMSRYYNIQELLNDIKDKLSNDVTLEQYLADVSLIAGIDQMNEEQNSVTFMTIHSAKGLEFPVVFISGCEEEIFPLAPKFNSDSRIEEERRLFYVALTRAEMKVYITYARSRYRFGEVAYQGKSRFLDEIDPDTFVELNGIGGKKVGSRRTKKDFYYDEYYQESFDDFNQEQKSLRVGSKVEHEKFGVGKVQQISGNDDMQRVTVLFEDFGMKQLLVKFAKLKVL